MAPLDEGAYVEIILAGKKEDGTDGHSVRKTILGMYDRKNAKRFNYAWAYGGGDFKLGTIIRDDMYEAGKQLPPGTKLHKLGAEGRAKLEQGVKGLGTLITQVKSRARNPGYLKGLDGRKIHIRSPHAALNTLLQGGGAVVMKLALVIADEQLSDKFTGRYAFVANVHDEYQIETYPDIAEEVGQISADAIREAGVRLGVRCPLSGSYAVGNNWAETH